MAVTGIVTGACALPVAFVAVSFWLVVGMAAATLPRMRATAMTHGTMAELSSIKTALDAFEVDNGRYPTTAEGLAALTACPAGLNGTWAGPYVFKLPVDPWFHPYVYRGLDTTKTGIVELLSAGPDGVEGTADDVTLPRP